MSVSDNTTPTGAYGPYLKGFTIEELDGEISYRFTFKNPYGEGEQLFPLYYNAAERLIISSTPEKVNFHIGGRMELLGCTTYGQAIVQIDGKVYDLYLAFTAGEWVEVEVGLLLL